MKMNEITKRMVRDGSRWRTDDGHRHRTRLEAAHHLGYDDAEVNVLASVVERMGESGLNDEWILTLVDTMDFGWDNTLKALCQADRPDLACQFDDDFVPEALHDESMQGESQGGPFPTCRLYGHADDHDPAIERLKPWFDEAGAKVWIIGSGFWVVIPWPEGTNWGTRKTRLGMATLDANCWGVNEGVVARLHDTILGTVDIATKEDVLAYAERVRVQIAEFLAEAEHLPQG